MKKIKFSVRSLITLVCVLACGVCFGQEKTIKGVNSVRDLATVDATYQNTVYVAEGFTNTLDGGAGVWRWYSTSTAATNTTDCIAPQQYGGRWIKIINSGTTVIGSSTNYWTLTGSDLHPNVGTSVTVSNLTSAQSLAADGAFILSTSLTTNLVAGVNDINPYQVGKIHVTGFSSTPSASQIGLSSGHGTGQLIIIENYTGGNGFCITNGTPLWDDGSKEIILPNGDWCPLTEGESIWLMMNGHGNWVEVDRINPGGTTVFETLTINNAITVQNYITIGGNQVGTINPTDGRLPYRTGTNAFGDSPWFRHATNIVGFGSGTNQFIWQQDEDTFALGYKAGGDRLLGNNNVAVGNNAMERGNGEFQSVAFGNFALYNGGGSDNVAIGHQALMAVNLGAGASIANNTVAIGFNAMKNVTNGYNNVGIGSEALQDVGDGRENTAVGWRAGDSFDGVNSIFLGSRAGTFASQTALTNVAVLAMNMLATNNNDYIIGNTTNAYHFPGATMSIASDVQVAKNVGATLTVGDTTFVDLLRASQTNTVSGALAIAHATNGVHGLELTHVRWIFNASGSDQTLTIPSGWRTNVYSAVPPAITNGTITRMVVTSGGGTADAASQTNCYVAFEYYK